MDMVDRKDDSESDQDVVTRTRGRHFQLDTPQPQPQHSMITSFNELEPDLRELPEMMNSARPKLCLELHKLAWINRSIRQGRRMIEFTSISTANERKIDNIIKNAFDEFEQLEIRVNSIKKLKESSLIRGGVHEPLHLSSLKGALPGHVLRKLVNQDFEELRKAVAVILQRTGEALTTNFDTWVKAFKLELPARFLAEQLLDEFNTSERNFRAKAGRKKEKEMVQWLFDFWDVFMKHIKDPHTLETLKYKPERPTTLQSTRNEKFDRIDDVPGKPNLPGGDPRISRSHPSHRRRSQSPSAQSLAHEPVARSKVRDLPYLMEHNEERLYLHLHKFAWIGRSLFKARYSMKDVVYSAGSEKKVDHLMENAFEQLHYLEDLAKLVGSRERRQERKLPHKLKGRSPGQLLRDLQHKDLDALTSTLATILENSGQDVPLVTFHDWQDIFIAELLSPELAKSIIGAYDDRPQAFRYHSASRANKETSKWLIGLWDVWRNNLTNLHTRAELLEKPECPPKLRETLYRGPSQGQNRRRAEENEPANRRRSRSPNRAPSLAHVPVARSRSQQRPEVMLSLLNFRTV
ncbi:hypothetical protein OIO90_004256 [Microbotryomycetes sp. JL221]|nr:hypothetical protein OIO90_004256 [Microbotryomycetes sp. JL221]